MTKYYEISGFEGSGGQLPADVQERAKGSWKPAVKPENAQCTEVCTIDEDYPIDIMAEGVHCLGCGRKRPPTKYYLAGAFSLQAENERLREALEKIVKHKHHDLSCSLEAQGYSEIECIEIGVKHDLAMIAQSALYGKNHFPAILLPISFLEWVSFEGFMRMSEETGHKWFKPGIIETYDTTGLYRRFAKEIEDENKSTSK